MVKQYRQPPPFGSSYSTEYILNKNAAPQVSAVMSKSVSEHRRGVLQDEVAQGVYKDGSTPIANGVGPNTLGAVTFSSTPTIRKNAQSFSGGFGGGNGSPTVAAGGGGGTIKQIPEIYSPLWLTSNLNLPRDRATINAWCRAFFALNPFVHNAINLHSTYPISKLNIKCADKSVEKFFNDMSEEIGLLNICVQMAMEYWLLGETFVHAELDKDKGRWGRLLIQNPDYMVVNRTVIADEPIIMLRPDENLKRIVQSNKPADIEQRKQLNQYIVDAVRRGENIPLNNFNISHIARKISPYEIRGTGLPVSIFRQLMLFDLLRESKFAQAQNMINPLTLVKIGSNGPDGLHPTHDVLESWRDVFAAAQYDKDFKIFTHPDVNVERVGYGQGIYDISGDITQLVKEMFIGLMTPPVVMDGTDITYNNGGVALDVLRQRYMEFRNRLASWLKRKIFAPISEIQGFWEYKKGAGKKSTERQLIIPDIDWNHMSLFDAADYTGNLIQLLQQPAEGGVPKISYHTLYRSLGLEWEDEQRKIRKEAIQTAIYNKEKAALDSLTLNELRSLTEEEEIPEVPGATPQPEQPVPGETSDLGGMGGGGLGGLPGLGGPSTPPTTSPPPAPPTPAGGPTPTK